METVRAAIPREFDEVVAEPGTALKGVAGGESAAFDQALKLRAEIKERDATVHQVFAEVEKRITVRLLTLFAGEPLIACNVTRRHSR